jgi:surfeit locus 1 family protein
VSSRAPHSPFFLVVAGFLALVFFAGFLALGTWQVERRAWKLDLIDRVEHRVHVPAVPMPPQAQWPGISAAADEYRRVTATGMFLNDAETLVQAVTDLGSGYWVLTPLWLSDGSVVLVNRGFVPPEKRDRASRVATELMGMTTVIGLMRMNEPGGGFLRRNDPAANRWYSRDVRAIAEARGLSKVAPFFIDEEAGAAATSATSPAPEASAPVPGLTVIAFHNSHLLYAITWYTLALMVLVGAWLVVREERRLGQ